MDKRETTNNCTKTAGRSAGGPVAKPGVKLVNRLLWEWRELLGIDRLEAARRLEVHPNHYASWENRRCPNLDDGACRGFLGVVIRDLFHSPTPVKPGSAREWLLGVLGSKPPE